MFQCVNCKKEFKQNSSAQKYCCEECKLAYRFSIKKCEVCNQEFQPTFKGQKTCCDQNCKNIITLRTRRNSRKFRFFYKPCLCCGKEIEVPKKNPGLKQFCCPECFYNYKYRLQFGIDTKYISKTCEACKKEFITSFIRRNKRFCCKSCALSGERNPQYGKRGELSPTFGRIAWNNGFTVETDDRVAALGRKISEKLKDNFTSGRSSHVGENNPMFGHTPDMNTPEEFDNYSRAAVKRIQNGQAGYGGKASHYLTGIYECKKSTPVKFKSSWELAVMMWWDKQDDVISYQYEPINVKLEDNRRAVPDFLVKYVDAEVMFEVKPTFRQKQNKDKLELVAEAVSSLGYEYVLIGDKEYKQIIEELGQEYVDAIKYYEDLRGC